MKSAVALEVVPKTLERHGGIREFKPILLGLVMRDYGIPQAEFAKEIKQKSGKPLSRTALSFLVNYGEWPTWTSPGAIKVQIESQLRAHGVSEEEIAAAWEPDPSGLAARNHKNARPPKPATQPRRGDEPPPPEIPEREMLNRDAKKHFQLLRDPFIDEIKGPDDIYLASDQRYIREAMHVTAKNGGFIAVVGESGAGKTILRLDLIERVQKEGLQILFIQPRVIDKKKLTARMVCEAILDDLAPGSTPPASLERLARKVETILIESYKTGNRHVLLIEESQDLEPRALKHLKRFYELQSGYTKLLSIILVGQPELKELLNERQHFELREVIRRCEVAELQPLDGNVRDYLTLKLDRAGKKVSEIFTDDAFDAIVARLTRDSSRGKISMVYPLVVNNVVTKAMNLAASMGEGKVSADVIREV